MQNLQHGSRLGIVRGLREQRLVDVRVEGAVRLDLLEPVLARGVRERALDEANTLLELRFLGVRVRASGLCPESLRALCSSAASSARSRSSRIGSSSLSNASLARADIASCSRAVRLRKLSNSAFSRWSASR